MAFYIHTFFERESLHKLLKSLEEHDDKRLITLVPVVNAAGDKLPLQLIFKGTDGCARSIPDYKCNFRSLLSKCPG